MKNLIVIIFYPCVLHIMLVECELIPLEIKGNKEYADDSNTTEFVCGFDFLIFPSQDEHTQELQIVPSIAMKFFDKIVRNGTIFTFTNNENNLVSIVTDNKTTSFLLDLNTIIVKLEMPNDNANVKFSIVENDKPVFTKSFTVLHKAYYTIQNASVVHLVYEITQKIYGSSLSYLGDIQNAFAKPPADLYYDSGMAIEYTETLPGIFKWIKDLFPNDTRVYFEADYTQPALVHIWDTGSVFDMESSLFIFNKIVQNKTHIILTGQNGLSLTTDNITSLVTLQSSNALFQTHFYKYDPFTVNCHLELDYKFYKTTLFDGRISINNQIFYNFLSPQSISIHYFVGYGPEGTFMSDVSAQLNITFDSSGHITQSQIYLDGDIDWHSSIPNPSNSVRT